MKDFLNLSLNDPKIQNWQESDKTLSRSFPNDIIYLSQQYKGIQLGFENNILNCIFLFNIHKHFKPYSGDLPYNLTFSLKGHQIL